MDRADDILDIIATRKSTGEPFALATVVRTVAATAAKAGAKAVIRRTERSPKAGSAAAARARRCSRRRARRWPTGARASSRCSRPTCLRTRRAAGEEREGVRFARNMCPSHGTMDIFVEPVCPGRRWSSAARARSRSRSPISPAERLLRDRLRACRRAGRVRRGRPAHRRLRAAGRGAGARYVVVSTQGRGDEAALIAALAVDATMSPSSAAARRRRR